MSSSVTVLSTGDYVLAGMTDGAVGGAGSSVGDQDMFLRKYTPFRCCVMDESVRVCERRYLPQVW